MINSASLECRHISKRFGGVLAVDDVSLSFEPGRITALIGPNGAGKTTLFHLICGSLRPDAGGITLRGQHLDRLPAWRVAAAGVGRLFQDVRVFGKLTAVENVLTAVPRQLGENPLAAILLRRAAMRQESANLATAVSWLKYVGLSGHEGQVAENLSYGQQKLLALARLLASGADVLLLDEPTAGVNPELIGNILRLLRQLAAEGRTIVLIEHNMDVVLEVADWVNFMDDGQLVAFGSPADVLADRTVRAAYLGT